MDSAPPPSDPLWDRLPPATGAISAAAGFAAGIVLDLVGFGPVTVVAYAAGIVVGGAAPARDGIRSLTERRLDVDLLMVVAAVAAAGLGQWRDGSLLILIFATTGLLEELAVARTTEGVRTLLVDAPDSCDLLDDDGSIRPVPPDRLLVGQRFLARQGSRIPTDGTVVDGEAALDEASLTGEALPARKVPGRPVLAGTTVVEGAIVVEATAVAADSTLARLAAAVDEAVGRRPPTQLFIERFEQRYSIGVVIVAVLIAVVGPSWWGWDVTVTITRTMTFLVVASPCAVVLASMPATLSALAAAARHRVLIRGGPVLERLATLDVAAFDKTGTLTRGDPRVVDVSVLAGEAPDGLDGETVLAWAAAAESWSEHPIGRAIVAAATDRGLEPTLATGVTIVPSRGVRATVDGRRVEVGGAALVGDLGTGSGTVVGVAVDGALRGLITLEDEVRGEAACTVSCLGARGVFETWLLTGDHAGDADRVAAAVGIDRCRHSLLPDEKAEVVRDLAGGGREVVYVGDGVNDAAALTAARVGVSLGRRGSALAVDSAGVILMDDDLHRLPDVIGLARRTQRVIRVNLAFALTVIVVLVALDLAGRLPLILGVLGHEGSSVVVALNGLRLLRWRPPVVEPGAEPEPVGG